MSRTLLITALLALIAPSGRCLAQASSSLPVIRPKVTELGGFRDTALFLKAIPHEAALSPRGTHIAYVAWNDDLRIWSVRTHANQRVLSGWSQSIVWSPGGDAIAFVHAGEGSQDNIWYIWMLRLNPVTGEAIGSPQRVSLTPATGAAPTFSPDGKSIAFPRKDSGDHSSLVVVPAAGGTERVLASGYDIHKLRWAVDGSAIYYASGDSSRTKAMLNKVPVAGGATQLMHDFAGENSSPALSPDNRAVMLSPTAASAEQAMRVGDLGGRALATLSIPPGVEVKDWSGEYRLAGVRVTTPRRLRIVNVSDGKSRELIDSTADVQAVAWFEDSRRIAAIAFYDGVGVLVTMNADGTSMRRIPLAAQPFRNPTVGHGFALTLAVSPDGRYAFYQGPGRRSLELVDLSAGKQRTLARASVIEPPVWRSDSKTIRYDRLKAVALTDPTWREVHDVSVDGIDKLVRAFPNSQYPRAAWVISENFVSIFGGNTTSLARLDGSPDQLLLRGSTRSPGLLSPDGRTIAVSPGPIGSAKPSHKVTLLSLSDGSQRTVELPFTDIGCATFSPDGRYLYCTGRETNSGPQTFYEVPLDGSKPRVVTRIDTREFMGANVLSPDRKWLLQTVAGVRRAAFVSLDFTDGITRLLSSSGKR